MAFDDGYPGGYFIEAAVQAVVVMLRQQSLFGPGMDGRLTDAEAGRHLARGQQALCRLSRS